jgi:hypothetical protein
VGGGDVDAVAAEAQGDATAQGEEAPAAEQVYVPAGEGTDGGKEAHAEAEEKVEVSTGMIMQSPMRFCV